MRNKGFFWFLTVLLTAICLYQLSFTWVTANTEAKADKEADIRLAELKVEAANNEGIAYLPNNTKVDFSKSDADEIAKSAFVNQVLKEKADSPVYPIFGSTFKDVKQRSLAFGLDLVGGMSVTLEISIPELVKSFARNERDNHFKKPYESALEIYAKNGGDFISIFMEEHKKNNGDFQIVRLLAIEEISTLSINSTNDEVVSFLREKVSSSMSGVEQIMERRINQFGVAQPNIQRDATKNRLYIELPGVQDETTVAERLQSTANLQFFETYQANEIATQWNQAAAISKQASNDEVKENDTTAVESLESLTSLDANASKGLAELVQPAGTYSIGFVSPEDKSNVDDLLRRNDILSVFPEDLKFMWSSEMESISNKSKEMAYTLYAVRVPANGKAKVGGTDIKSASTGFDQQSSLITVDLTMSQVGAEKWGQMTSENVGRVVAITMDDVIYSAPRVINAITAGNTQISGSFSVDEAKGLAGLLNGGALPAPCVIKDQSKVGPTIGAENTKLGLISFAVALACIFIYMIFYYGKAGIIADIALFANIIFIFGTLASFGAVLTLAGIAGVVLTIGMAVDANVIIFERIREEIASGKDNRSAIDAGFKKSLSSIIDANVTTLLTAIILKVFGSGVIESFATTLIIGLFTSLFAALVISRLIMIWMLNKGKEINFDSKITRNAFKGLNIDFIGKRKMFYGISAVLVVISLIAIFTKGLNPSVEFSGGRTFGVKFENSAEKEIEYLRGNLETVFVENGKKASTDVKTKSTNFFVEITTNYKRSDETANNLVKEKLIEGLKLSEGKLGKFDIVESRSVSPSVSQELINSSSLAVILSIIMIFAYILIRFGKWQYSAGAILSLAHDVTIVLGIYAIFNGILPFNMDVDQAFIAAILTLIGYSINDTVIVFDRIREITRFRPQTDTQTNINEALNSTMSRTINTSFTTFFVLLVVFVFGPAVIQGFVFAMMIGVVIGTYSSIYIATPFIVDSESKKIAKK
jgi:SecD/SecF fusion protein